MRSKSKGNAVILLYHQVGNNPVEQTNLDCYCDEEQFEEQMSFLSESTYKVISLDELVYRISSLEDMLDDNYVVLTFDDGCSQFSKKVLPILNKYNFPSTLYPVTGCLGKIASWPKVTNPDLRIITKVALKSVAKQGVNIGAHTANHIKLTSCNLDDAKEEIDNSKKMLENLLGTKIASFSYPHGDYNKELIALVKSLGFSNAVTCNAAPVEFNTNLFELPRKYITYFDTIESFKKIIAYEQP
jgi:peptidoglycan/xylan/chitin deacetylase (PgdA/CDA1 family)